MLLSRVVGVSTEKHAAIDAREVRALDAFGLRREGSSRRTEPCKYVQRIDRAVRIAIDASRASRAADRGREGWIDG